MAIDMSAVEAARKRFKGADAKTAVFLMKILEATEVLGIDDPVEALEANLEAWMMLFETMNSITEQDRRNIEDMLEEAEGVLGDE